MTTPNTAAEQCAPHSHVAARTWRRTRQSTDEYIYGSLTKQNGGSAFGRGSGAGKASALHDVEWSAEEQAMLEARDLLPAQCCVMSLQS